MVLRPLGATGLLVSPIGLGTVKLGRNTGVKYPAAFALPTDDEAAALLAAAADLGVNLIDTAPAYGTSEERLGSLMAANNWFGGRDRWVVSTKAGEEFDAVGEGGSGESWFDFSAAAITASVERSLERFRTDRLDIVLLHSDGRDEWVLKESGGLEALLDLKRQGKVRAVGISSKAPAGSIAAISSCRCDVVMVAFNRRETAEARTIAAAAAAGIGVLVKKGLESGHAPDPECAVRFVLSTPGVSSLILGTTNPTHLRGAAVAAF